MPAKRLTGLSILFLLFSSSLLLFFSSCANEDQQDKHPEIKYFPEFNTSNANTQLQQLSKEGEDVRRVYVSRDKKKLILIVRPVEKSPADNYYFRVYDESLNLIKEIIEPELDGLFGQDDLENIYAGKGYFEHNTYQYRPIQQLRVTDKPGKDGKFIEKEMKTFEQMLKIGDTLLSFQRKDYKGSFYFLKKSGTVYQIFFKDCAYCEGKYNAAESVSEYRAADNGADQVFKPSERSLRGWIQKEPLFYYQLKNDQGTIDFKISYPNENLSAQLKKIDFAGKPLLLYQLPGKTYTTLYFFKDAN
ncbi:hypothetical protein OQX61_06130 [Pedobacter sp. PLR]|uniref:hypothetical protein n=1 Tax=Pedobacter sp. PLR TaxID=2994465 RepID=UPI002246103D|nr:hypothetical protein [Pedobacter sp. PLR]MCX2450848.1 hypothetical protein [Pedobacter sp. PLR]